MPRISRKSSIAKRKAKRVHGKLQEHVYWDEPEEKVRPITLSTARLRREHKRAKAKKIRERKEPRVETKPLVMMQPLSARGAYAERTEIRVPSTVIFWVEYYPEQKILIIAFRVSGKYYTYFKVPLSVFQAFRLAPSKGRYFNKYIKGKYSFARGAERP